MKSHPHRFLGIASLAAVMLFAVSLTRSLTIHGSTTKTVSTQSQKRLADKTPRVVVNVVAQPTLFAQKVGTGGDVLVQADRSSVRRYRMAKEMIGKKQYLEAFELLQRVLDQEQDAFFTPDPNKRDVQQSLRQAAHRLLASMPQAGRDAYQLKFGQKAAIAMQEALKTGRLDGLTDVARRYFHTQAGYQAMYRLGVVFQDRGENLAAGLCFDRLRNIPVVAGKWEPALSLRAAVCWQQAGLSKKSTQALAAFLKHNGDRPIDIQGKSIRPFAKAEDGPTWLTRHFGGTHTFQQGEREWVVYRGNMNRNGVATLPKTANPVSWKLSTIVDPDDETADVHEKTPTANIKAMSGLLAKLDATVRRQTHPSLPAAHPLVVGETLIVRKLGFLRAIELKTGTRLWESLPDENLVMRLQTDVASTAIGNNRMMNTLVQQWTWHDLTRGTMSSDGRRVYAIEETAFATTSTDPETGQPTAPFAANRLIAYDLQTGRINALLGGNLNDRQPGDPLPGTFILGAPLPLAGRLYILGESNGEIELIALKHREESIGNTHRQWLEKEWSQPLVSPNRRINQDRSRRLAGASISYSDGIMVCCTEAGYVVGVDLTSRSLLWAYRYDIQNLPFPGPFPRPGPPQQQGSQWTSHAAVIADGKVLLTPQNSNELHCLNLIDGSVAWKITKGKGRYLAGVTDGRAIIVGDDFVNAVKLSDGKSAWTTPAKITSPSGQGLIAGKRIFIPTATDGIVMLDISTGKLLGKKKFAGDRRPGNLLISGGTMLSQGIDSIDAFPIPGIPAKKP